MAKGISYGGDPHRWLGKAVAAACEKTPGLAKALALLVQERAGVSACGAFLSAARDAGLDLTDTGSLGKREVTPERREQLTAQLAKARAARKKKQTIGERVRDLGDPAVNLQVIDL